MKVRANINGKVYVRTVQRWRVSYDNDGGSEKLSFIFINSRPYLVFTMNGIPQSVYDWEKYQQEYQPNYHGRLTSRVAA